jgi:Ca2+-binding EF-hand superfamily protein
MNSNFKDIDSFDVNILNEYEKQKCIEAFNIYDKNGSKRLEKEELRIVLEGILIRFNIHYFTFI